MFLSTLSLGGCHQISSPALGSIELIGVLADVVPDLLNVGKLPLPVSHTICWLLVLKSPKDGLVLNLDPHHLLFAACNIQTSFIRALYSQDSNGIRGDLNLDGFEFSHLHP